jgi:Rho-binding antiterminator
MMRDDDDYTPIACGLYSEYEVAILRCQTLRLQWRDDSGVEHSDHLIPRDLHTRNHREYMVADNPEGVTLELRLDRIFSYAPERE